MPRAERAQFFLDDAQGEFGAVALAAQVAEVEMTQVSREDFLEGGGGVLVGEMTVPAEDSLLEAPGPMRTFLKHLHIVIRLEHEDICGAGALDHELGDMAQVGDETQVSRRGMKQEADGVLGIVRDGERFHEHVANLEGLSSFENPEIQRHIERAGDFIAGWAVAVNGEAQLFGQGGEALGVVRVLVGDQDGVEFLGSAANGGEAKPDLARAQAGVHEDADFTGLDISGIPR